MTIDIEGFRNLIADLRDHEVVDELLDDYAHVIATLPPPNIPGFPAISLVMAMAQQVEDAHGADVILRWGGWGGVLCGWTSPACLRAAHAKDISTELGIPPNRVTDEQVESYHDRLIFGDGIYARTVDDLLEHPDELTTRCDECGLSLLLMLNAELDRMALDPTHQL